MVFGCSHNLSQTFTTECKADGTWSVDLKNIKCGGLVNLKILYFLKFYFLKFCYFFTFMLNIYILQLRKL